MRSREKTRPARSAENDRTARDEAPRKERALAAEETAQLKRAHRRLQELYEISKILTRVARVDETVFAILSLLSRAVPLELAILMVEGAEERTTIHTVIWHAEGVSAARLLSAKARATSAYAYLVRPDPEPLDQKGAGLRALSPAPSVPRAADERAEGFVFLPLVVEDRRIFGALEVQSAVRLDEGDLMFVNAVVNQLAVALDRTAAVQARQTEAESRRSIAERAAAESEQTAESQRFLSETTALLSSSLEYVKTLASVVRAAIPLLGDVGFIDEIDESGRIERHDIVMADPRKQRFVDRIRQLAPEASWSSPPAQVLRSGVSVLVPEFGSLEAIPQNEAYAEILRELGVVSMMCVPLIARRRTLGALTLAAAESGRRYSASDLDLAEEVGRRAGLAIDNAQLYEQAQRAIQARQDLLAIVSHDLRNPLGTILLSTASLRQAVSREPNELFGRRIEAIQRSADRMNRLIGDLLDLASIDAGHLTTERKKQDARRLVEEAVELNDPMVAQKKVRLNHALPSDALEIDCDRERVLQVIGNLIGNAMKFTPEGGTITVKVERRGRKALFSVVDSGCGIAPEDLPHVFDRYWQAKRTAHLGTGLGLSISRGLIEMQGGRIWAQSKLGAGATFSFTLPLAKAPAPST